MYVGNYLTVTPAPLTITADNKYVLAGAAMPSWTCTPTGFVNGDNLSKLVGKLSYTTTATNTSTVGTYPITVKGAMSKDYTITYVPGTFTVGATMSAAYLMPDPLVTTVATQYILYVWGTAAGDTITIVTVHAPGSNEGAGW